MFFFSCTLCYWCIYLPFLARLPPLAVWGTLCNVRNTSPSVPLHCEQVGLMCSSHSFILSLLKSRSALLFINCLFHNSLSLPAAAHRAPAPTMQNPILRLLLQCLIITCWAQKEVARINLKQMISRIHQKHWQKLSSQCAYVKCCLPCVTI